MSSATTDSSDHRLSESQWAIAARQFRKRATAVGGLHGVRVLFYLAVFAPVLCSALPLVYQAPGAETEYPWISKVFDKRHWESGVDRIYNLLMFLIPIWWGMRLFLRFQVEDETARASKRSKWFKYYLLGVIALALMQAFGVGFLNSSKAYVDYHAEMEKFAKEEAELKTLVAAAAGEEKARMESRLTQLGERSATFTFVPFGHRSQSAEGAVDQFRSPGESSSRGLHVLGTAKEGQDVLATLIFGTRISLTVGILAVAIYVTIGLIMGGIAGFFGGWVDILIMRLIEIILSIPGLFLILTIIALFNQRSIFMIMIAIGIVGWTGIARLVRGEFIRERAKDYVSAARSLGLSNSRILFRHVMPNSVGPVIVSSTFGIAAAIITESTLSFLGLGDTSVPSWGQMLNVGRQAGAWHMILVPGFAIFITVTLLNLVGDGLRDAMDPKLRK